jgi:phosphatidylglycerophosphatase A
MPEASSRRPGPSASPRTPGNRWVLLLAEGLGSGRLRPAPGTWGSLVGLIWFAVLLAPGHPGPFFAGALLGIPVAVWSAGRAEHLLGRPDPGSVVVDEIVAVPLCFVAPLAAVWAGPGGVFPDLERFLRVYPFWLVPGVFGLFRLFDIWKPWPVRQSQRWPGGRGIVADDLLAAVWVNLVLLPFLA